MTNLKTLNTFGSETIAYHFRPAEASMQNRAGVIWLGGFKSDMSGTKALALDEWSKSAGRGFIRFDYFGHGQSSGDFIDGTISRWRDDALAVLDQVANGPQVLVGSSMGGWLAILATQMRPEQVKGLALVAPAPDFTEDLIWSKLPPKIRQDLESCLTYEQPTEYDEEAYLITLKLIEDGRSHLVLRENIAIECPVRILHGMKDEDVPWTRSLDLVEKIGSEDIVATFVKAADHRLSDAESINRLLVTIDELCRCVDDRP